jgi:hypothetical protein
MGLLAYCSWVLGTEVDGAQDSSWRCCCFAWLYLPARPSHVGVNVDGIACPMHYPMVCVQQTMGQSFLSGVAPPIALYWAVAPLPGGCEAPQVWKFDVVMTVRVPP